MKTRKIEDIPECLLEKLKSQFAYEPETGTVTNINTGNSSWSKNENGYPHIRIGKVIDGKKLYILLRVHQIAHILMTNNIPEVIYHINGDRTDNKWENLKSCTREEKLIMKEKERKSKPKIDDLYPHDRNKKYPDSYTFYGVQRLKDGTFSAYYIIDRRKFEIGIFKTNVEAALASDKDSKKRLGRFAILNFRD